MSVKQAQLKQFLGNSLSLLKLTFTGIVFYDYNQIQITLTVKQNRSRYLAVL